MIIMMLRRRTVYDPVDAISSTRSYIILEEFVGRLLVVDNEYVQYTVVMLIAKTD